jgi:hypothetical protein
MTRFCGGGITRFLRLQEQRFHESNNVDEIGELVVCGPDVLAEFG